MIPEPAPAGSVVLQNRDKGIVLLDGSLVMAFILGGKWRNTSTHGDALNANMSNEYFNGRWYV